MGADAGHGGAVFADGVRRVSVEGGSVFSDNAAPLDGGAIFATGVSGGIALSGVSAVGNAALGNNNGGVLFADEACASVSIADSDFTANVAGAGPVAFLDGWGRARGAAAAPVCTGRCSVANNTAAFWGGATTDASVPAAVVATDIETVRMVLSRPTVSSGAAFNATVTLYDGFGTPVESTLPGVTFTVECFSCDELAAGDPAAALRAALRGAPTASKYVPGAGREVRGLSLLGPQGRYNLSVTVDQNDQFVNRTLTATAAIDVVPCSATEEFKEASGTCECTANAARNADGDCQCNTGTHVVFKSPTKGAWADGPPGHARARENLYRACFLTRVQV